MENKKNNLLKKWFIRLFFLLLALIPLLYPREFYDHFYSYLTGTIISEVIRSQWRVVVASIIIFVLLLIPLSFRKRAKWFDYGLVSAFFVSLFVEMYGVPLTIIFASKYFFNPGIRLPENAIEFSFLGVSMGADHAMVYGGVLMILGAGLIMSGWYSLYTQTKNRDFARHGLYAYSRNPQYVGFILLIIGWFFGWPTILTLVFSPILIYKYIKAGMTEEKDMESIYEGYKEYKKQTPFLI